MEVSLFHKAYYCGCAAVAAFAVFAVALYVHETSPLNGTQLSRLSYQPAVNVHFTGATPSPPSQVGAVSDKIANTAASLGLSPQLR